MASRLDSNRKETIRAVSELYTASGAQTRVFGNKVRVSFNIDVWQGVDAENGIKTAVKYNKGKCVFHNRLFYWSLEDNNIDEPPSSKWTVGKTVDEVFKPVTITDINKIELGYDATVITVDNLDPDVFKIIDGVLTINQGDK